MANITEVRPGNFFIDEGNLYQVQDILLNKTAMRKMVAKVKVKNMRTGSTTEISRNSGYDVETVRLDKDNMSYLYDDGSFLVFMNQDTYEQISIPHSQVKDASKYLKGEEIVEILSYEGEVLGVNLPAKVALKVTETEPSVRGDTINKALKKAVLETGLEIKVPMFISEGETIIVRTDTGEYDGRSNN